MTVEKFWENFSDGSGFVEVDCADAGQGSLAIRVLDAYSIPYSSSSAYIGGELPNFDIKRMDAMQVIRQSLMEYSATEGGIWEPIVDSEGEVEFKNIGTYDSGIEGHIYYQVQTMAYREECKGVMITGGKPLITRKPLDWKPIWGNATPVIYKMDLATTNCMRDSFSQYATIVFPDPHMTDTAYDDGIDNLYEILTPYESIVGWVYKKEPPEALVTKDTEITYTASSEIPIQIGGIGTETPYIGNLIKQPTYPRGDQPACWSSIGEEANYEDGVRVHIPPEFRFTSYRKTKVDTFVGISKVYVVGKDISNMMGWAKGDKATSPAPTEEDTDVWVTINNSGETVYELTEGIQYTVAYDTDDDGYKIPYIVFADLSKRSDPTTYGNGKDETGVVMNIDRGCAHFDSTDNTKEEGTVLPLAETKGIWVKQIFVVAQLNTPSIVVFDPNGKDNKAMQIAEQMSYTVSPIVIVEEPNPVAFNGTLLDLQQSYQDHDPTTTQDFSDTQMELALDEMDAGGMSLTFSYLDGPQCATLSQSLYEYMNNLDGIETAYVCDPECDPKLGGVGPAGGIINSIKYSYTDSGSYIISPNEGPRLIGGFSDVSGGPTAKAAESVSAEGIVIQDMGNHIYFKVRIDGFEERIAINCSPEIIRVRDRVSCSVHNNPVEA